MTKEKLTREEILTEAVNRFLGWSLPPDFNPDGGIEYTPSVQHLCRGTNLFTANQARQMFEHALGDLLPNS